MAKVWSQETGGAKRLGKGFGWEIIKQKILSSIKLYMQLYVVYCAICNEMAFIFLERYFCRYFGSLNPHD